MRYVYAEIKGRKLVYSEVSEIAVWEDFIRFRGKGVNSYYPLADVDRIIDIDQTKVPLPHTFVESSILDKIRSGHMRAVVHEHPINLQAEDWIVFEDQWGDLVIVEFLETVVCTNATMESYLYKGLGCENRLEALKYIRDNHYPNLSTKDEVGLTLFKLP